MHDVHDKYAKFDINNETITLQRIINTVKIK